MTRAGHRVVAGATTVVWGVTVVTDWFVWVPVVVVGVVTGGGVLSPDVDQYRGWRRTVGRLPWCGHRQVTHWWLFPLLGALAASVLPVGSPGWVVLVGVVFGWGTHIVGDVLFGGVPLWPGGRRVGLKLRTGGRVERWVAVPAFLAGSLFTVTRVTLLA